MFRTVPLSIISSFSLYTQQWYTSYRFAWEFARKLSANLYDIHHFCVYIEKLLMMDRGTFRNMQSFIPKRSFRNQCKQTCMTYTIAVCTVRNTEDGQRNFPKHVEFYSKKKFKKLVHLVGFIIRIYHDARSPERPTHLLVRMFSLSLFLIIQSGLFVVTSQYIYLSN